MSFNKKLSKQLLSPWKLRLWMLRSLTMGLLTGMIIVELNEEGCRVKLKDRWWIRNPFRSVYWAVMSMAAEMSTGALLYAYASEPKVQFILVEMKAKFYKKVRGKSFYFCRAGEAIRKELAELQNTNDTRMVILPALALDESGTTVAEFEFYWQLRKPIV
jgi:hypothetical protein